MEMVYVVVEDWGGGYCNKGSYICLLEGVKMLCVQFVIIIMVELRYAYIASGAHFIALGARDMSVMCTWPCLLQ